MANVMLSCASTKPPHLDGTNNRRQKNIEGCKIGVPNCNGQMYIYYIYIIYIYYGSILSRPMDTNIAFVDLFWVWITEKKIPSNRKEGF